MKVAVLIPCLNEEKTVSNVVKSFKTVLPEALIYVYDNGSTDSTVVNAKTAGAILRSEKLEGKGSVVRRMFADIEADIYVLVDGDGTYDSSQANVLVETLVSENLDMVVGTRISSNQRLGHGLGNKAFNFLYRWLFGNRFTDIFSGYRVLSRRFVKSFPAMSEGFEIETEISVHASQLRLPISEIDTDYLPRQEGSESKLRTFVDGWNILISMFSLLKNNRPLFLFGTTALLSMIAALIFGIPVIADFIDTGLVEKLPTAVLATGLSVISLLLLAVGWILDSVVKGRLETKRIAYLQTYQHNSF